MTGRAHRLVLLAAALLAALLASLATGCGGGEGGGGDATSAQRAARARMMGLGARVFAEHCQTCHPLLGEPNTDIHSDAPELNLDEVDPTTAYVRERLESGGVGMGAFSGTLREPEFRAVLAYVVDVAGRDVTVPRGTSDAELAEGRRIYLEHCQRCHAIDGRPANRPNPIWVGTDFEDVRPSVLFIEQRVREGQREAMPAFRDRLRLEQIRAVALYVNAAAR